ncbi:MAG: hypothetical protein SGJ19_27180 [Planctomycetia bacterium]|nr:hypothetical protein [Planctomycetia bacterium]
MRKAFALRLGLAALMVFQSFPLRADAPDAAHRAELQQRLDAKLAELEAVEREVQQLQQELNLRPQLMVHVKMFEVSLTKMEQLQMGWAKILPGAKTGQSLDLETLSAVDCKIVDELVAKNLARIKADPTIVTLAGRPAQFHTGGETPVAKTSDGQIKYEKFGTHVELTGSLTGKDRIRLELKVNQSDLDFGRLIEIDGKKHPGLRVSEIQTSLALKPGESVLLPGRTEERTETALYTGGRKVTHVNKIQSMMLVTAELIEAPLPGVSTVHLQGQQPPQPDQSGYSCQVGGTGKLIAPHPLPMQEGVKIQVEMIELSLTKLRNLGYDVDDVNVWKSAMGLDKLLEQKLAVAGDQDVILITPPRDVERIQGLVNSFQTQTAKVAESGAAKNVGSPRAFAKSGEQVSMTLSSPGAQRETRQASYVSLGPGELVKTSDEVVQLVDAANPLGYRLEMTPTVLDLKKNEVELTLNFSLSEPLPGAAANESAAQSGNVVSRTERKLHFMNGQHAFFSGEKFQRAVVDSNGEQKPEVIEEFVPVYMVVAFPTLVAPAVPPSTAAESTRRK